MKLMTCPCGEVISGDNDEEFLANVKAHLSVSHPTLLGTYSDEQILSRAEQL